MDTKERAVRDDDLPGTPNGYPAGVWGRGAGFDDPDALAEQGAPPAPRCHHPGGPQRTRDA